MKREAIFRIAGIFILFMLPGTLAAQYQSPDLKTGKKLIKNILILPPEASILKSSMKGSEPLVAESHALENGLSLVVGQALSGKGCNILQDAFGADKLDQNSYLKYALSDLQARYDKLQILLSKKPKGVQTSRFSVGDEVANFSSGAAADGLVFVRAKGVVPTAGLKTFVVLTGMGFTRNYAKVNISVVDAQSGTILYFSKPNIYGNFIGEPESMKEAINKAFSNFRFQDPPKN